MRGVDTKSTCGPRRRAGLPLPQLTLPLIILLIWRASSDKYVLAEREAGDSAAEEKRALLAWKTGLEGFNSGGALSSWTPESQPCEDWEGVTCQGGLVLALHLASQGLRGTLPEEVSLLTNLQQIMVKFNHLSGPPIPHSWSVLQRLVMIDAANNELTGSLSDGDGMPPRLNTLLLQNNRIRGPLPSQLRGIQYLALESNHLTGTLPSSWAGGPSLKSIKLGDNHLHGPLPEEWSAMGELRFLELQDNRLTGELPAGWMTLSNVRFMELFNNRLDSEQLEEVGRELGAQADWVLLPQRNEEEGATGVSLLAGQSTTADRKRLFSETSAEWSPKVVRRGGVRSPGIIAIAVGGSLALSLAVVALLVWYSVAAVRAQEVRPLLMTNLEEACTGLGDKQQGSGLSVINVRGDSSSSAEGCAGSRMTKRSNLGHMGRFLLARPPPMMTLGGDCAEGVALDIRGSPSRHHTSQKYHHGGQC